MNNSYLEETKEFKKIFYWAFPLFSLVVGGLWFTACGERDIFHIIKDSLLCGLPTYLIGIFFLNGLEMDLEKEKASR